MIDSIRDYSELEVDGTYSHFHMISLSTNMSLEAAKPSLSDFSTEKLIAVRTQLFFVASCAYSSMLKGLCGATAS